MPEYSKAGIPFEICHEQENFRLLEIPSGLLRLITSKTPPSLSLKSPPLEADGRSAPSRNYAVLCTDDTTFNLRQVHSSNAVHLIVPTHANAISSTQLSGDQGLTAIAQCATTLELIPFTADATSILKEILPLYNGTPALAERGIDSGERCKSPRMGNKQELFENVPLSRREFEEAWLDICAFETNGHAWVPSALDRSGIWKSIISAATLENAELVEAFDPDPLRNIVIEQDAYPEELFDAVLRRLCTDWRKTIESKVGLSQEICVTWVGDTLLEVSASAAGIAETDFLRDWRNQLPEHWRQFATCSALKCEYFRPFKGTLRFGTDKPGNSTSVAPISGKRLGKWHEKFKNTR